MSCIDGFPHLASDPDGPIQALIDSDLKTYHDLTTAFERDYPRDQRMGSARMLERIRHSPRAEALFPILAASDARAEWLMPVVRRFAWNRERGEVNKPWAEGLAKMARLALEKVNTIGEREFLVFAGEARALAARGCVMAVDSVARLTRYVEKAGALSPVAVDAIRSLVTRDDGSLDREEHFVWPLFRSQTWYAADDPCWSARVRRDVGGMDAKLRAQWFRVFDFSPSGGPLSKPGLSAMKRLGDAHVEECLRRWVGMLSDDGGPVLSAFGTHVFRHFLYCCQAVGGKSGDQLMYEIASAPWSPDQNTTWLWNFLSILEHRTDDRAFAMLEALAMNPATCTQGVRHKYEALLSVFGTNARPAEPVGVDGYPLDRDPLLQPQQLKIDQLLRMGAEAAARGPHFYREIAERVKLLRASNDPELRQAADQLEALQRQPASYFDPGPEVTATLKAMVDSILEEFAADPAGLHLATAKRLEWIKEHQPQFSKDTIQVWWQSFRGLGCEGGLMQRALQKVDELPIEELLKAIQTGRGDLKVFELAKKYVTAHGWDRALVEPMRKWVSTLGTSHTDNYYRAQVEWFLWFENVAPFQMEECWSHRVKQDLRGMTPEERAGWMAILENSTFVIADRPARKWFKAAEAAFPKLDESAFRRRFVQWFEPFARSEPVRLTITGRNVLRLLMWYALLANDPAVDQALAGFANAKWKTKEVEKRVAQAEMAFAYVLAERAPEAAFPILDAWVKSGRAYEGSSAHKVYQALCSRLGRTAADGIPEKAKPEKTPQAPKFDASPILMKLVKQ